MIKDFIKNNDLLFTEGNRNLTVITCIGYAQHLGWDKEDLKNELVHERAADPFISEEIERLWNWAASKNYKNFWDTPRAKKEYKF
jgi:hypothetical protein